MPWAEKDVKRHKKGLSTSQKKKWARIANAVLDKSNDEVLAIKVANSRTKRMNENVDIILNEFLNNLRNLRNRAKCQKLKHGIALDIEMSAHEYIWKYEDDHPNATEKQLKLVFDRERKRQIKHYLSILNNLTQDENCRKKLSEWLIEWLNRTKG